MPPNQLHLIRHAQGFHNLSLENHKLHDPSLTPEGERQCLQLSKDLTSIHSVECIISSPMRRTLYTALITFREMLQAKPHLKIIALPELQETSDVPCDTGSPLELLKEEFSNQPIDFSLVPEDWARKDAGPFSPRVDLLEARARVARHFLRSRPENTVAVVLHGSLLHFLTENWVGSLAGVGTGWRNAEYRTYTFNESREENKQNASIVETQGSRARRDAPEVTGEQHAEMMRTAQAAWAASGYVILPDAMTAKVEDFQSML